MPRDYKHRKTANCPFCGKAVCNSNFESHISACVRDQETVSEPALRRYIIHFVSRRHPRCVVCNNKYVTAITKAMFSGEKYIDIVEQFSGKNGAGTFTVGDIDEHKRHLNVNLATVLERNMQRDKVVPTYKRTEPFKKAALIDAITGAVIERDKKLTSLELTQVAKLNIAKSLYSGLQDAYENNMLYREAQMHPLPVGETYPPGTEPPAYAIPNDEVRGMEGMFLKYMESVGELQIKILKFYEGVGGTNAINVNSEVILTVVQNMELAVLQHLSKAVKDAEIRLEISIGVGEIFNKTNEELNKLLLQNQNNLMNPVDIAYEEVKNSIFNTMGKNDGV